MLTGHWDLGNFIRALARDPTMKDLGGSDRLDSRLSFYLNIQPEQFGVHGTVSVAKLFGKINSLAETETALTPPGKAAFMQAHEAIYFPANQDHRTNEGTADPASENTSAGPFQDAST